MDKSKAISILKTFSRKELVKFGDFLGSPYFNKGKKYISRFYREIIKYYPGFENEQLKKNVYSKLYPGEKYNDERFRKLTSELYKLLLEFLAAEQFFSTELYRNRNILSELNDRKLDNLFELELKRSNEELEKLDLRNQTYFKEKYELISKEKFYHFQRKRLHSLEKFDSEIEYFSKYTITLLLAKYIERMMEKRFFNARTFEMPLYPQVISFLLNGNYLKDPIINTMYLQLVLCTEDNDSAFHSLRKLAAKYEKRMDRSQIRIIYTILSNYAIERSEKGVAGFQKEILNLYLEIVKKNLIEQYISAFLFVNIVTLFLKFNRHRELEIFLSKNSERLNPEIKDAVLNYCHSCITFYKKNYDKALEYLSRINFDNYQLRFQIKNLSLKIYYEQKSYESIYSLIDSYKHILKRETAIPQSIKNTIHTFIETLKELTDIRTGKKKSEKVLLLKKTEMSNPAEKLWLLEKINELYSIINY